MAAGQCLSGLMGVTVCHYRSMQVSAATRSVHALLCLDLDDRILWYNTVKVCVGRLGEPL